MNELNKIIRDSINDDLIYIYISGPRDKQGISKIKIRPILIKHQVKFQVETFKDNQAFHNNYNEEEAIEYIMQCILRYRQVNIAAASYECLILISKKGKVTIKKTNKHNEKNTLEHNRSKKYILEEGIAIPFLIDLGVMNDKGIVLKDKFHKYRQINRFLEFIRDVLPALPKDRELTIVDFGCGKSYLTFAIYYYLVVKNNYKVNMIGLDLKEEVIKNCSNLANKYGYEKLKFHIGDIKDFKGFNKVDMVVTLHACDTATDYALEKAVDWDARVILSVPCCQHEVNSQINNELLKPIFKYGLIKERMSSLITDALRAEYLESVGYDSQILEFIEMEHTPKNILIRATKGSTTNNLNQIKEIENFLKIEPTIGKLLEDR
ncbi:MAG: class I SAM-dependent methyltransferase [Suipraeoptans sp.]